MKKNIKILIIVFLVLLAIILYARYIGTMGFITKEYTIVDKDIPIDFDGIKIVHFSDVHYNRAITLEKVKNIVNEINQINPDIVVFTGDLVDKDVKLNNSDYDDLINVLSKIDAKYGKYAIMGNHDYVSNKDKVVDIYNNSNFKYLENDYDIIYSKNNEKIFIGGVNTVTYKLNDIDKTMEYFNDNDDIGYKIILVHEPDISDEVINNYTVNLILAGHSHNGQIRLPFVGSICTPPDAKKYYDNYYDIKGTKLYISSGVGVSNVNYRLFNRPSINFYRINKEV